MNKSNPRQVSRPKRRKDKYNPYTISKDEKGHYTLAFKDGQGITYSLEISEQLYTAFNEFELSDLSALNIVDRHIEHSVLTEQSLHERAFQAGESVEETVIQNLNIELLKQGMDKLPEIQKRRLSMYYFEGLTYEEIAALEGCKHPTVIRSIQAAIKNLKHFFENRGTI